MVVTWVNIFQTELMVEIHFESPVRAVGEVLLMKFRDPIKVMKYGLRL